MILHLIIFYNLQRHCTLRQAPRPLKRNARKEKTLGMDHAGTKITSFGSPPKSISKQHSAAALAPSPSAIRKTGTKNHQSLQTLTSTAYQSLEIDGVSSNENNNIMLNEIMNGGEMNRDDVAMVEVDQLELADGATTSNAEQVEGENDLEEEETKPPLHSEWHYHALINPLTTVKCQQSKSASKQCQKFGTI